ncbi:hypothetical protein ACRAKI_21260 [Saccharothrix isguenensis]
MRRRAAGALVARAWVVESDYVHPDGLGGVAGVAVPYPADPARGRHQPFRFLGRTLPLEAWQPLDTAAEYVTTLTAVGFELAGGGGYSEPAFAALYPNCHSVFGFHDGEIGATLPTGLRYDVVGWYADVDQDFLHTVIAEPPAGDADALPDRLKQYASWTFTTPTGAEFPDRLVCYASVGFVPPARPVPRTSASVALGNTGTEALATALAAALEPDFRFELEDTLEAVLLAPRVAHQKLDVAARFRELRHEKGFTPHRGEQHWTVRPITTAPETLPADAERGQTQVAVDLPPALAGLLAELNEAQADRDRAANELESARRQLFADWYKYQICAYPPEGSGDSYPDIDQAKAFLERKDLPAVAALAAAIEPGTDTPESRRRAAFAATARALDALNAQEPLQDAKLGYTLVPQVAPRFWQPTDPVVLLTGDEVLATERHGQDGRLRDDGLLECHVVADTEVRGALTGDQRALTALMDGLRGHERPDGGVAFRDSDGAPWNPFQLEWQVELFPLRDKGNIQPQADSYDTGFITAHYGLSERDPDLVPADGSKAVAGAVTAYAGSAFLTKHAGQRLGRGLVEYLNNEVMPDYRRDVPDAGEPATVIDALRAWYEREHAADLATPAGRAADQAYTVIRAYEALLGMGYLAQSLGGFNDALLMHRQVKQLPIGDPLGFAEYRAFAETVNRAVGTGNRGAPEPLNDFNPIRSGGLRLLRLRLVDTFGSTRDVPVETMVPAESLTTPDNPALATLPPRLSQPARIVFRWLAADLDVRTNDHPTTTPVCGWVLPNHVETSLMIYDNAGRALGSLDRLAAWQAAPGGTGVATVAGIPNPHLRSTVADIQAHGVEFLSQLMGAVDTALDNIEPETGDQHIDLAVLVGRPMALVRAELGIELLGRPAVHQGWNQFRQDMGRNARDHDGFTRVEFPLRLGSHRHLGDGLVGYWLGDDGTFYSPQPDIFEHSALRTYADEPLLVKQAIDDPNRVVRMLVDPRGAVHVTSGIQPVKSISIPPPMYAPALAAIEVFFPCAPLLTDPGTVSLPLPVEPGYRWTWLAREHGEWAEVSQAASIGRATFVEVLATRLWDHLVDPHVAWLRPVPRATGVTRAVTTAERATAVLAPEFRALTDRVETVLAPLGDHLLKRDAATAHFAEVIGVPIWQALLAADTGWLAPLPGDPSRAVVTPKDGRPRRTLAGALAGTGPLVDELLDLGAERVGPTSTEATFGPPVELRSGWLKLRRDS